MPDRYGKTELAKVLGRFALHRIGATDLEARTMEQAGDTAHPGPADADEDERSDLVERFARGETAFDFGFRAHGP